MVRVVKVCGRNGRKFGSRTRVRGDDDDEELGRSIHWEQLGIKARNGGSGVHPRLFMSGYLGRTEVEGATTEVSVRSITGSHRAHKLARRGQGRSFDLLLLLLHLVILPRVLRAVGHTIRHQLAATIVGTELGVITLDSGQGLLMLGRAVGTLGTRTKHLEEEIQTISKQSTRGVGCNPSTYLLLALVATKADAATTARGSGWNRWSLARRGRGLGWG